MFIDPNDLVIGETYVLSRRTPLMPHYDPSNPLVTLKQAKSLREGVLVTIRKRKKPRVGLWYRVKAMATNDVVYGWINASALMGQRLKLVPQVPMNDCVKKEV